MFWESLECFIFCAFHSFKALLLFIAVLILLSFTDITHFTFYSCLSFYYFTYFTPFICPQIYVSWNYSSFIFFFLLINTILKSQILHCIWNKQNQIRLYWTSYFFSAWKYKIALPSCSKINLWPWVSWHCFALRIHQIWCESFKILEICYTRPNFEWKDEIWRWKTWRI